jgi:trans-aconitate methyltransferase
VVFERCKDRLGPFDVAFSNAALHWVIDQPAFLRALKGCMKPGGRILFQMGGKGNALDIFVAMFRLIRSEPWSRWFEGFTMPYAFLDAAAYRDLLVETGFEPVRVELIPRDMAQDGAEGLESWVRTTWLPFKDRLPEELWQPLVHDLVSGYIETHPLDAAGKSHVTMIRLEVEAVNPE